MMRVASRGDGVLHFLEDTWPDGVNEVRLAGTSKIAHRVVVREDAPPNRAPGEVEKVTIELSWWTSIVLILRCPLGL